MEKAKNPTDELMSHLKANFRQPNPGIGQFRDENIWVELLGDVVVYNALNLRYEHKRFKQEVGAGSHAEALKWLKEVYKGQPQPVPEKYAV